MFGKQVFDVSVHLVDNAFDVPAGVDKKGNPLTRSTFITFTTGQDVPYTPDGAKVHKIEKIMVYPWRRMVKVFYDDGMITTYTRYKFIYSIKGGGA